MNTPWGKSDHTTKIQRGVSWVDTPGHGGLAVTKKVAMASLSVKAIGLSDKRGDYLFFEEDCLYAIAFYEHPEWKRAIDIKFAMENLNPLTGEYRPADDREIKKSDGEIRHAMGLIVQRWFPEYFVAGQAFSTRCKAFESHCDPCAADAVPSKSYA